MDFFSAQERARRLSGWLVALFVLAIALIVLLAYVVLAAFFLEGGELWDAGLFVTTAGGIGLVVVIASAMRSSGLRSGGGSAVAEMLGGRLVSDDTTDSDERRMLNVVEEMALAAGTPVPASYVLDGEEAINAFAAGYSPEDAVVGFTRGALRAFTRDELQAVAAHEFSHIVNRDIRLNIRLTGLLFGILVLGLSGRLLLRASFYSGGGRRDGRAVAALVMLGLTLFVAGYVGVLVGRIIRAGVSRQREYLADAAAVQFTRNPDAMAGALRKIGAAGSRLETAAAEEVSHFFFANGLGSGFFSGLWSTHPPLEDRIRRIDPSFDGDVSRPRAEPAATARTGESPSGRIPVEGLAAAGLASAITPSPTLGTGGPRELDAIPESLVRAAHDPLGSVALTYALILDRSSGAREGQFAVLEKRLVPALRDEVLKLLPEVDRMPSDLRLVLVDVAAPALRRLSDAQSDKLVDVLTELAAADRRLSVFEFALKTAVRHRLGVTHGARKGGGTTSLRDVEREASVVLAALALVGSAEAAARRTAYEEGARWLGIDAGSELPRCTSDDVRVSLDALSEAEERLRARLIEACSRTVMHDGVVRSGEIYLLRAIAAALDVPLPARIVEAAGRSRTTEVTTATVTDS